MSVKIKTPLKFWQHAIVPWFYVIPPVSHVMSHVDYCYYFVTQQTRLTPGGDDGDIGTW